jgi:hypothetical protein
MIPLMGPAFKSVSDTLNTAADKPYLSRERGESLAESGAMLAPDAVRGVANSIPSFARASRLFDQVKGVAGDMPIDVQAPGNVALRIRDLADRGGSMPKAASDFLKRITDPAKGDMTFNEARDFYSNISRLSADEMGRLTPVMQRAVGDLRTALNGRLQDVADIAGKGPEYTKAMTEYRRAAKLGQFKENVKEVATKAAANAAGVAPWYYALSKILGH